MVKSGKNPTGMANNQSIKACFENKTEDEIQNEMKIKFKLRQKTKHEVNGRVFEISPPLKNDSSTS